MHATQGIQNEADVTEIPARAPFSVCQNLAKPSILHALPPAVRLNVYVALTVKPVCDGLTGLMFAHMCLTRLPDLTSMLINMELPQTLLHAYRSFTQASS